MPVHKNFTKIFSLSVVLAAFFAPAAFYGSSQTPYTSRVAFAQDTQNTQNTQNATNAPIFVFWRNLRLGDTGEDVRELQKLLNSDPVTRVSATGNGSLGLETLIFGPATQAAVMRFQQKYANEVLRPAGVAQPSGFVGLWTRLKLNQILLNGTVAETPAPAVVSEENDSVEPSEPAFAADISGGSPTLFESFPSNSTNVPDSDELSVHYALNNFAGVGKRVTLVGSGFSKESNTVVLTGGQNGRNYEIKDIASGDAHKLTFTIPQNVLPGRYDLSVSTKRETSTPIPFMVTVPNAVPPIIEKIEPASVKFEDQIKITGKNFTPTGNIFTSGVGIIRNLESIDGTTLVFTIPTPEFLKEFLKRRRGNQPLNFVVNPYIVNNNGISGESDVAEFTINI